MRSKIDEQDGGRRAGRAAGRKTRPPGGKVLQRLLAYLGEREPLLVPEAVPIEVPAAAQPKVGPARQPLRTKRAGAARSSGAARAAGTRRAPTASRSFARAIAKAATRVSVSQPRARKAARAPRARAGARAGVLAPVATAWTEIGPLHIPDGQTYGTSRVDVSGRVSSLAIDPANARHLLCGSANGGIWESTDDGATWAVRTDQMPSLAIGAVTFDPHDPTRAYAGSGEGNFYATLGAGIYVSRDGGTTWKVLAGAPFIGLGFHDLVVDPADRRVLYAATTGGFFVSTNSGTSWSRKRQGTCWDITVHPQGGTVEILATFADGLFSSANQGSSFQAVPLPSSPAGSWTRLAVDRVTASPDVAYAFGATSTAAHLWRRTGTVWSKVTALPDITVNQAWYDWYVAASPTKVGEVYLGAIDTWRGSLSSGAWNWRNVTTRGANSIHPDQHCLTFAPGNANTIYAGNDGGVYRSANSGNDWTELNRGLGITEIEYLGADPATWKWLMAGTQDNGTIRFTGATKWDHIADGDGGDCGVNQLNPNQVYHSYYGVSLERSSNKGNSWTDLEPPDTPALFYPPVEVSGMTVAIGGAAMVVTRDAGQTWTTTPLGLPARDAASAMRAVDANTFLVGTTQGLVIRATWNGSTWIVARLASPAARFISCIAVDPSNPSRVWVTLSQVGGGRVFRSDDGGATWVDCSSGLPPIPFNTVVVDPADFRRVWVGADVGVYESRDLGASWTLFSTGLPNAMAVDLLLHRQDRVLFCATRSRGVWAIEVP